MSGLLVDSVSTSDDISLTLSQSEMTFSGAESAQNDKNDKNRISALQQTLPALLGVAHSFLHSLYNNCLLSGETSEPLAYSCPYYQKEKSLRPNLTRKRRPLNKKSAKKTFWPAG